MADTTVKIDDQTRDRFQALAADAGMSMRAYLAQLAVEMETQQKLGTATAAFRAAIARPGFAEAFDRDFSDDALRPARTPSQAA
ncbi:antitoxin MazE7 [Streptomyces sp. AV19]|uniref:antitoxin MazE7 n=1 Tax=Streptomyces sp. AV19 TaxID=2793068 RepID=UPI0018FE4D5D|nr:antitoxin MazE7 [Streptomyces sp. AV19]MBH1933737.1 antitoxin MazE7 [Streptomyces sp. AV19]MDG4535758.1 antitoxin MazE7 [Streptomyces sp. AV19]